MAEAIRLISSSSPVVPPPPPPPKPARAPLPVLKPQRNPPFSSKPPRRNASLLLLSLAALAPSFLSSRCHPAAAFSLGISGPKEWLRNQKKKASKFVLAPIEASRQSLRTAYALLTSDSGSSIEDPGEVRKLLNVAARDCVPKERSSIVAFQARTGVEVCTFRLIVKNASSLLDDRDPVKLEAEAMLGELIRSFAFLGSAMDSVDLQLHSDRQRVQDGLMDTISELDKFEQSIKDCLGV